MEGPSLGPGNGTRGFEAPDEYYIGRGLFINFIWFVGFAFASSLIFWQVEEFAFQDAFYHVIMTSTTIGLGDIAPVTQAGRLYGIVNMCVSVVLLGAIIGTILSALDRRVASQRKAEFLKKQIRDKKIEPHRMPSYLQHVETPTAQQLSPVSSEMLSKLSKKLVHLSVMLEQDTVLSDTSYPTFQR